MKKILLTSLMALTTLAVASAQEVTEDFENVSLVNADTWGRAQTLSNGWIIQGGYIGTSKDSYEYGFWTTAHDSEKSLTAQYGSTNNAYVIIPEMLMGDVTFYYRKTSSDARSAGKVYAYKVTETDGTYTIGTRIFMDESATTAWQQCTSIHLTEPTMIAFKMVRAAIDDVTYSTASTDPHEHSYASEWSSDAEGHWHACTSEVGICDAKKSDMAAHDGAVCSVCGYEVAGIKAFPWNETFNNLTTGIPSGWDNSEGTVTTDSYKWNANYAGHEGKCVRFDSYNNIDGRTNVLATPYLFIPETGEYKLDFWCKNAKGGDFTVKVAEYGSDQRTTLAQGLTGIDAWTEQKLSLADFAGKIVKLYFCGTSNYGTGDAYIYLDDVTVKERIAHTHDYAEEWSSDYTSHWHACLSETGECDALKTDVATHAFDADGVCTVCGYDQPYMVDFEDGIPATWNAVTGGYNWKVVSDPDHGNGTAMAYSYMATSPLTSPLLHARSGEVLSVEALLLWDDETLTMEYSADGGETWEVAFSETPEQNNTLCTLTWTAPADGDYLVRFSGRYNYIDNICGFKLATTDIALRAQQDDVHYATFSSEHDVVFTQGTVYTATVSDGLIQLTPVANGYVPANTGVIVGNEGETASYVQVLGTTSQIPAGNQLRPASALMEADGSYLFYKLAYDDYTAQSGLGFYWGAQDGAAFTALQGGAYLALPAAVAPQVKGFAFGADDMATGIQEAAAQRTQVIYNVSGQRQNTLQRGINIVNGKKVLK